MAYSTNHQCPACTGPLRFDAKTNLLVCDYCDSKFPVEQIDAAYAQKIKQGMENGMGASAGEQAQAKEFGTNHLKTYTCSSCSAQLFCDEVTVAASCPYCGNPNVIAGKFSGGQMPDVVIPFKMEKNEAIEALSKFYKGKKLLPKVFSAQNHIEEVKGVYVPFWFYSGNADVNLKAAATRAAVHRTSKEIITTTSHYVVERKGNVSFENVPVDASKKMDNDMMDSLEPFDYSDLKKFTPSYLPGYLAEAYDENPQECVGRLEGRVSKTAAWEMERDIVGYDSVSVIKRDVKVNLQGRPKYAFLPVWLLSTRYKDKNYLFAMNGQTGKMVGKLPVDKGRFCGWFFGVVFGVAAVLTPIIYFAIMKAGL